MPPFDWNNLVNKLLDPYVFGTVVTVITVALRLNVPGLTKADPHFQKKAD